MDTDQTIQQRLNQIRLDIKRASSECVAHHIEPELVAVSKFHTSDQILAALNAGQRIFGENRVQEAADKWPSLKSAFPDCKLHLIGPLQSNKVKLALQIFDVIETVDREKIATSLAKHMQQSGLYKDCYIQINTGEEQQKAGIIPTDADAFIAFCKNQLQLKIIGLMCIPPVVENPAMHFALLKKIADRNEVVNLSMGMSADYKTAIRFGATHVRIGTAIFGPRPT